VNPLATSSMAAGASMTYVATATPPEGLTWPGESSVEHAPTACPHHGRIVAEPDDVPGGQATYTSRHAAFWVVQTRRPPAQVAALSLLVVLAVSSSGVVGAHAAVPSRLYLRLAVGSSHGT
jgi:hypothetical protein